MKPKEFIQKVLIDEVDKIIEHHPYIAFSIMTIGIEFLGKCINGFRRCWCSPCSTLCIWFNVT